MPMRIKRSLLGSVILFLYCLPTNETAATSTGGYGHQFTPICDIFETAERAIINPKDTQLYWICANGTSQSMRCSGRAQFNAESGLCEADVVIRRLEAEEYTNGAVFECPPRGIHRFAIENSCTDYHYCVNGIYSYRNCADELHFDKELSNCNFMHLAQCRRDWCPRNDPTDGSFVTHPSPENCGGFFVCSNGKLEAFQCVTGLYWNQAIQDCDFPSNVDCSIEPPPATETPPPETTSTEPSFTCPNQIGVLTFPHPSNCAQFYLCVGNRIPFLRDCAEGLEFDPEIGECSRPDHFKCAHRIASDS